MAILERDKSIPIIKDKFFFCYDPLNLWFRVNSTRKNKAKQAKTDTIAFSEDLGFFATLVDTCRYTLDLNKDNKILTEKMRVEIQHISDTIGAEHNETIECIKGLTNNYDSKDYKIAIKKYLDKKKTTTKEFKINDDIQITFVDGYVYFSCRFKNDMNNARVKQEYRWEDMGYYPLMHQAYFGLYKRLMLKEINDSGCKDMKVLLKLVIKKEKVFRDLIAEADKKIRKELHI